VRVVLKALTLSLLLLVVSGAVLLAGQIPASFRLPILGYVLDNELHAIRPIVGILGNSRIGAPIDLGLPVHDAAFLADQKHAIVVTPQAAEALVVDLEEPSRAVSIAGSTSSISMIRASADGKSAALYAPQRNQLLVVSGMPGTPAVSRTIDVSRDDAALKRFAISNDGTSALLAFRGVEADMLYSWDSTTGLRFVTGASRISDIAFIGADAVVTDAGADQVFLIRGVRDQASPMLIADAKDGIKEPAAVSISIRNEIYIGSADTVLVMDANGHLLRRAGCGCTVTTMVPLRDAAIRLTDQLDLPVLVLDGRTDPERVLFIPALSSEMRELER
jgi:hypothetical protein